MTQSEQVLEFMKEKGGISAAEAFRSLGITRLSARIYDLRKAGYQIDSKRVFYQRGGVAKHYDVYTLGVEK